ncbi:MAG TPA: pilus assembly protein PilM [Spirochaetota bacterium]|nr:pilus assembly protein PilM [Spirochaetota bacterium]
MFDNIAALDIGTSSIKLVTVKTSFKDFQVTSFAYEDIDFRIESTEEAVRDAISRIIKEKNLKGYTVYTNLPMEKAIIRNITFPFNDVEKIAEAIPFEAEENIPFRMEDLAMDFQSLKSTHTEEGRILLTATHKETIQYYMELLDDFDIHPVRMGLESNALFECYRYFNKIHNESIIQLDIGHNKSIINFISENNMLYTRSIPIGTGLILQHITETLKIPYHEALRIFENLHLDLTSLNNNIQRDYYKALDINRQNLKKIFDGAHTIIDELLEQLNLTIRSFSLSYSQMTFSRLLISGGGSNLIGLGQLLSNTLELPIVSLPFLEGYDEIKIHTQFPIAFGIVLSVLNRKHSAINFLKGEFLPDMIRKSRKIYYLAGGFLVLAAFVFIVNLAITALLETRVEGQYEMLLQERVKRYFHVRQVGNDPVKQALKILSNEKKELNSLKGIIKSDVKVLDALKDILVLFPRDESFLLNNLVLNESILRIDGTASSSVNLDLFKNKLQESNKYESVVLNTNLKRRDQVGFMMTIKMKIQGKK